MKRSWQTVLLFPVLLLLGSCVNTQKLAEGEYILKNQRIDGNEHVSDYQLEPYYQQNSNRKVFGSNLMPYVWLYQKAARNFDPSEVEKEIAETERKYDERIAATTDSVKVVKLKRRKNKKLDKLDVKLRQGNWLMRSIDEPLVIINEKETELTAEQIRIKLQKEGYFNSKVSIEADTSGRYVKVNYIVQENRPHLIRNIQYIESDDKITSLINTESEDRLLVEGTNYDEDNLVAERNRITELLRNTGYYEFSRQFIFMQVDTLNTPPYQLDIRIEIQNPEDSVHDTFTVDRVIFTTDYDVEGYPNAKRDSSFFNGIQYRYYKPRYSKKVLDSKVSLRPGDRYSQAHTQETQRQVSNLNIFKFVNLYYQRDTADQLVAYINASPLKRFDLNDEVGIEGSFGNLPGPFGSIGVRARNIFGGAEIFDINVRAAIEGQAAVTSDKKSYDNFSKELSGTMALTFPQIVFPLPLGLRLKNYNPKTRVQVGYLYNSRPEYERTNITGSYTYTAQPNLLSLVTLTLTELSLVNTNIKDDSRGNAFRNYLNDLKAQGNNLYLSFNRSIITNINASYVHNSFDFTENNKAKYYRFYAESGGPVVNMLNNSIGNSDGEVLGLQYYQYFKLNADIRYYFPLSKTSLFAVRFNTGLAVPYGSSKTLPYEKFFFSGGSSSNRGWAPRRLGPGAFTPDKNADGTYDYRFEQPGEVLLETNYEYRFNLFSFVDMATFIDAGNVWRLDAQDKGEDAQFKIQDFYRQLGVSTGLGFRLDFSFLILRLDLGTPVLNPAEPLGKRFVLDDYDLSRFFSTDQIQYNIGIGYPF